MSYKNKPVGTWETKELIDWINSLKPRLKEQKDSILKTAKSGKKICVLSDKDWAKIIPNKLLCKLFNRELNKIVEENKNKKPPKKGGFFSRLMGKRSSQSEGSNVNNNKNNKNSSDNDNDEDNDNDSDNKKKRKKEKPMKKDKKKRKKKKKKNASSDDESDNDSDKDSAKESQQDSDKDSDKGGHNDNDSDSDSNSDNNNNDNNSDKDNHNNDNNNIKKNNINLGDTSDKDISEWTVTEVEKWFLSLPGKLSKYKKTFVNEHQMNGKKLMNLSDEQLNDLISSKILKKLFTKQLNKVKPKTFKLLTESLEKIDEKEMNLEQLIKLENELYNTITKVKKGIYDRIDEENQCCVCNVKRKNTLYAPCNHMNACWNCANQIKQCSVCSQKIKKKIKIFF